MGNALGNFKEYWDVFYKYDSLSGGCIWDWVDQGLWKDSPRGRYLAYGGDFDDEPNSGAFCLNGVVGSERHVTPKLLEMAHVFRNLVVRRSEDGRFTLENRYCFTNADEFDGRWELVVGGVAAAKGDFAVPSVAPLSSAEIIPSGLDAAVAAAAKDKELFVNFCFTTKETKCLVPKGWTVARDQIPLRESAAAMLAAKPAEGVSHVEKGGTLEVRAGTTRAVFDKASGLMTSLFFGGTEILPNGGGPRLTCARAFTDNDVWMVKPFFQSGLSQLHYHAERLVVDGGTVKSVVDVTGSNTSVFEDFQHTCLTNAATLYVTDTATLKISDGKKITGNGTVSLAAGTTLALDSNALGAIGDEGFTPCIPGLALPETGTATLRIDGTRLRSGEYTIMNSAATGNLANLVASGAAIDGRKASVRVEDGKLYLNVEPAVLTVIVR